MPLSAPISRHLPGEERSRRDSLGEENGHLQLSLVFCRRILPKFAKSMQNQTAPIIVSHDHQKWESGSDTHLPLQCPEDTGTVHEQINGHRRK